MVAVLLVGALPVLVTAPARAATRDPLEVTIDRLSSATVPQRGRVVVSGVVTNRSEEAWTDLNIYLLTSREPLRTAGELTAAAASDPLTEVGQRLVDPGLFADAPDLPPGRSTRYRLTVPRSALEISGEEGVYWLGVQVLATGPDGRVPGADGRARTFWPLVGRGREVPVALALQLRGRVARGPEGTLQNAAGWARSLSEPSGRMARLLGLAERSADFPLSLVLDPAVIEAAESVAAGNPPVSLDPTGRGETAGGGEASSGPDGDDEASVAPDPEGAPGDAGPSEDGRPEAQAWVDRVETLARTSDVLALPYGDLDVPAALRRGYTGLLEEAAALSASTLEARGVASAPVVVPPRGFLPWEALGQLAARSRVVLAEGALPGLGAVRVDVPDGARIVLTADRAAQGPRPSPTRDPLAIRQRILAEAALLALGPEPVEPLVVLLPPRWDPGARWGRSAFFAGLQQPWLRPTTLSAVLARPGSVPPLRVGSDDLVYPDRLAEAELTSANLAASAELVVRGDTLAGLLTRNDRVDEAYAAHALVWSSTYVRGMTPRARRRVQAAIEHIDDLLGRIGIRGQSFVTMSSETGTFPVTLVNNLDQPVTVGLKATVTGDPPLVLSLPDPVPLQPGQRRTLRVEARAQGIGVHQVTLQPTNAAGVPTGAETRFNVRASNLGAVIWVVMGVGGGLLLIAIVLRIGRRVAAVRAGETRPERATPPPGVPPPHPSEAPDRADPGRGGG